MLLLTVLAAMTMFFTTICRLQLDGLQRRRAGDEPRHGAGQRDQPHCLGVVDDAGQRDPQRPPHLMQRRLPRRRAQSQGGLHLHSSRNKRS